MKKDVECLKWDDFDNISLAGRYAPSQQGSLDKAHNAVSKLVAEMGISKRTYRREYLLPLRNFIREHRVEEKVEKKWKNTLELLLIILNLSNALMMIFVS